MTTIFAQKPVDSQADEFATIRVAGATVRPWHLIDNTQTVELDFGDEGGIKSFTPETALALAAALQSISVHVLEQRIEVAAA